MLSMLTPSERRAYMAAVGQEAEMPEATNRQLRRRMEHGGAGMPVRAAPVSQRPGAAGRKTGKNAKKKLALEVDAHHDPAEGRMTDLGEPGGGEDAAAADVELHRHDRPARAR